MFYPFKKYLSFFFFKMIDEKHQEIDQQVKQDGTVADVAVSSHRVFSLRSSTLNKNVCAKTVYLNIERSILIEKNIYPIHNRVLLIFS